MTRSMPRTARQEQKLFRFGKRAAGDAAAAAEEEVDAADAEM